MSGHTPGPWRTEGADAFGDHTIDQEEGSLAIAAVVANLRKDDEVGANARLIGASPVMYDYIKARAESGDEEATAIVEAIDARA